MNQELMNKSDIKFICEASDEAIQLLYMFLAEDNKGWEQNLWAWGLKDHGAFLGDIALAPNMVSIRYLRIQGTVVCFYYGESMLVNHSQITEYMEKHYPNAEDVGIDCLAVRLKHGSLKGDK